MDQETLRKVRISQLKDAKCNLYSYLLKKAPEKLTEDEDTMLTLLARDPQLREIVT